MKLERFPMLRNVLLGVCFALLVIATSNISYPQTAPDTVDQVRIAELERVTGKMTDHEIRIVRLEDAIMALRDSDAEAKWWYRGVGTALILAVLERILRTAGILKQTDGMGPVG